MYEIWKNTSWIPLLKFPLSFRHFIHQKGAESRRTIQHIQCCLFPSQPSAFPHSFWLKMPGWDTLWGLTSVISTGHPGWCALEQCQAWPEGTKPSRTPEWMQEWDLRNEKKDTVLPPGECFHPRLLYFTLSQPIFPCITSSTHSSNQTKVNNYS